MTGQNTEARMSNIDWVELWILNELVCTPRRLSRLILDPTNQSGGGPWAFPGRAGCRATPEARAAAVSFCARQGLVQIYSDSLLHDKHIILPRPLRPEECTFADPQFLERAEVVLSLAGHEKWEEDFQPDWSRYWSVLDQHHDGITHEWFVSILYSGDKILEELIQYFPSYWRLNKEVGLTELGCHTTFQYQASLWKIIPCAKVIRWKGQNSMAQLKTLFDTLPPPEMKRHIQEWRAEYDQACRILTRLSKRWVSIHETNCHNCDGKPEFFGE
jgi:hypothetical protein